MITIHAPLSNQAREGLLVVLNKAYRTGQPRMLDAQYDALWKEHQAARTTAPDDPVWQSTILDRVGQETSAEDTYAHISPMLSLDNVFEQESDDNLGELLDWLSDVKIRGHQLVLEPKIDGMSVNLIFGNGEFIMALTRGDGVRGHDITALFLRMANACYHINEIQRRIKEDPDLSGSCFIEVRGEIFVRKTRFVALNHRRKEQGSTAYSNPRNCIAGVMMSDKPENAQYAEFFDFAAHGAACAGVVASDVIYSKIVGDDFNTKVRQYALGNLSTSALNDVIKQMRADADYAIDGAVVKITDGRKALGHTSRAPRWAIALKFIQEKVVTILEDIKIQVGRTGSLTPVGVVTPIEVDGVIVSSVTLSNEDIINKKALAIGMPVILQRAGGVIPEIVGVADIHIYTASIIHKVPYGEVTADMRRDGKQANLTQTFTEEPFIKLKSAPGVFSIFTHVHGKCPKCAGTIEKEGAAWMCKNEECSAKLGRRIRHMATAEAFDIDCLGDEIADALASFIPQGQDETTLLDMYPDTIAEIEIVQEDGTTKIGPSRAAQICDALLNARKLPLDRWLIACSIPKFGKTASKEVARLCKDIDDVARPYSIPRSIVEKEGKDHLKYLLIDSALGVSACKALVGFLDSPRGEKWVTRMRQMSIRSTSYDPTNLSKPTGVFDGKTFVITGTLSKEREHFAGLIVNAGGKVSSGVSKKTDYVLVGENAGSKETKAKELGIKTLNEVEFMALLSYR